MAADEIDLGKLLATLLEAKWRILLITFGFSLLGAVYAMLATPIYKADALIQVESKTSGMSSLIGEGLGDMFAQDSSATTEIEIIRSRMVLGKTVDKLNLTTIATPNYTPVIGKGLARLAGQQQAIGIGRFELDGEAQNGHTITGPLSLVIDHRERGAYSLYTQDGTRLLSGEVGMLAQGNGIRLFVSHIDGEVGDSFSLYKRSRLEAIEWIKSILSISERSKQSGILQLSATGENKSKIEAILNNISQNYLLQNVERQSIEAEKSLTFLKENLPNIKQALTESEDTLNRYRQKNESVDLGLEAQSTLRVMVELEAQLNELTFKESDVSQRFTKDHPSYKSLLDKRDTLLQEKQRLNKQIQKLPKTQREVLRMTRDVEVNQQIYIQLLNKVQELSIVKASAVGNVRILDNAQAYSLAIKPKKSLIVVLATLLGGMLAVALTLIKMALRKGVENPDEIEAIGLSVYASVPKSDMQLQLSNRAKKKNSPLTLLATENPADLSIEALRGLRTSLHFAMMEATNNVVMISGPAPSIGKSFVSANFAAVAASTGQRVLLIDADMRKGYLHKQYNLSLECGLSDLLAGKQSLNEVVKKTDIDTLDIMTRGAVPPNPSELLMHPRFSQLIDEVSGLYDLVLIDTPPVLAVTDPSVIGRLAGTTLMVGRFGQNTIKEIEAAANRFHKSGIVVKGVILNAVEKKSASNIGYYEYAYK
ncbi:polysaccharide biosynthesis tyrosine autokinase [Vibrio sp. ZSDZ34]|uniref:Polysaccharide biosynthesis tyrosine autokinase n=1 Tax=Vibrio gelatinilyticus TaxID=2893468 RepID=A0A9X2AX33_9VIBR|nr:polysaccharide biosynthesis tyrosine autokinase [Vibrio gelatinilyticus]MCJ2378624.1 polysaccharide biosynthesis tyrosine autokinase [Vibrio gelatinilyticus]